jgi:hypothetical protein
MLGAQLGAKTSGAGPPPHTRCRRLSGRSQRVDARGRKTAPHRINALRKAALLAMKTLLNPVQQAAA